MGHSRVTAITVEDSNSEGEGFVNGDGEVYVGDRFTRLSRSGSPFSHSTTTVLLPASGSSITNAIKTLDEDAKARRMLQETLNKNEALLELHQGTLDQHCEGTTPPYRLGAPHLQS